MKTLMVTPFAPYRDGIATYAQAELRRLRDDGCPVEVLSPVPSAARWHLRLGGPTGMAQLLRRAADYERVIVQFGPELLFGGCRSAGQRVAVWAGLAALAKRTALDVRIHEIEYGPLEQNPFERRAARLALDQAERVTVHTEAERVDLNRLLGLGRRVEVVEHGRDFRPATTVSKADARAELGLASDEVAFVAIGFLQHHKGFDLAIQAADALGRGNGRLHVVGSARVDHPDISGYVQELMVACNRSANATLHRRFVSDVEFDLWLQAADAVVLPYREIWSSGVLERARLFDTPVIASDLPQLRDQAPPGTVFVSDVGQLSEAMLEAAERIAADGPNPPRHPGDRLHHPDQGQGPDLGNSHDADNGIGQGSGSGRGSTIGTDRALDLRSWDIDLQQPDRQAVQAQVISRARAAEMVGTGERSRSNPQRRPVDGLLALGHVPRPQPDSARPGVAPVKKLIDRLIAWQIDPLADRIEQLQQATVEAVAQLDDQTEPMAQDNRNDRDADDRTAIGGNLQ